MNARHWPRRCVTIARIVAIALLFAALASGCRGGDRERPPLVPPLSGAIGIATEGDLWLLAADGSRERRLEVGDWAGGAALSRDGRRVVFDTMNGIWTASAAGGAASPVPGQPAAFKRPSFDASWAPGGGSILFAGEDGIYRVDLTGRGARGGARAGVRLLFRDPNAHDPEWSSDGSLIAFVRGAPQRPRDRMIWLMEADGSRPRLLVRGDDPSFSPSGAVIAFSRPDGVYLLRLTNGRAGRPKLLVVGAREPVWSPQGAYVAYERETDECNEAGCRERVEIARSSGEVISAFERDFFAASELTWTASPPWQGVNSIELPEG